MLPGAQGGPVLPGVPVLGTKERNFAVVNKFGGRSHVWLGHGESDKVYNAMRTASIYDSVFVAGYGATGRYPASIRRWVSSGAVAIGTPDRGWHRQGPLGSQPRPVRRVLYAPTWEGHSVPPTTAPCRRSCPS